MVFDVYAIYNSQIVLKIDGTTITAMQNNDSSYFGYNVHYRFISFSGSFLNYNFARLPHLEAASCHHDCQQKLIHQMQYLKQSGKKKARKVIVKLSNSKDRTYLRRKRNLDNQTN